MTMHGVRAMARTILDEVLGFRPDFIEHQLAHAVRDPNGRAYNRTAFLPERRVMMQVWADYLDRLRAGEEAEPGIPKGWVAPDHGLKAWIGIAAAATVTQPQGGQRHRESSACPWEGQFSCPCTPMSHVHARLGPGPQAICGQHPLRGHGREPQTLANGCDHPFRIGQSNHRAKPPGRFPTLDETIADQFTHTGSAAVPSLLIGASVNNLPSVHSLATCGSAGVPIGKAISCASPPKSDGHRSIGIALRRPAVIIHLREPARSPYDKAVDHSAAHQRGARRAPDLETLRCLLVDPPARHARAGTLAASRLLSGINARRWSRSWISSGARPARQRSR